MIDPYLSKLTWAYAKVKQAQAAVETLPYSKEQNEASGILCELKHNLEGYALSYAYERQLEGEKNNDASR